MTMTLNPDPFFDQGDRLASLPRLRQVDCRRAISSAYYGVFHYLLRCLSDEVVGSSQRRSSRWALVYRSIEHRQIRELRAQVFRQDLGQKYKPFAPLNGFDVHVKSFAAAAMELQELRHQADYDPHRHFTIVDLRTTVTMARDAVARFDKADTESRKAFLMLLLCWRR